MENHKEKTERDCWITDWKNAVIDGETLDGFEKWHKRKKKEDDEFDEAIASGKIVPSVFEELPTIKLDKKGRIPKF